MFCAKMLLLESLLEILSLRRRICSAGSLLKMLGTGRMVSWVLKEA